MQRKYSNEYFFSEAKKKHGDKYTYIDVDCNSAFSKITIVCPIHGVFIQRASHHVNGSGCPKCADDGNKQPVSGVGILDIERKPNESAYKCWSGMLKRCYKNRDDIRLKTYRDCSVCKEWHKFSNFKAWFDNNHIEGCELDKDILVKGNKVYSPDTCCFVPRAINMVITRPHTKGRSLPVGVSYFKERSKYVAYMSAQNRTIHLGYFAAPEEAFLAYKNAKEHKIKELAEKYYQEGKIAQKVYEALMRYEVEP